MNTLLQPDVCVSEDYRWVHWRKFPLQPETALMLAVLEDTIHAFRNLHSPIHCAEKMLFAKPIGGSARRTIAGRFLLPTSAIFSGLIRPGSEWALVVERRNPSKSNDHQNWQKNRHDRFVIKVSPTSQVRSSGR